MASLSPGGGDGAEPPSPLPPTGPPSLSPSEHSRRLHPAVWGLILLAVFAGIQVAVGSAAYVALAAVEGSLVRLPREVAGANLSMFPLPGLSEGSTAIVLLSGVAASGLAVIPLAVMAHRSRFGSLQGFWARPSLRAAGYGLGGAALLLGLLVALGTAVQGAGGDRLEEAFRNRPQAELTLLLGRPAFLAMTIPVAGFLAPAAEEFMFRGFFHRALEAWFSAGRRAGAGSREPGEGARRAFWGAALLSGLLWGAFHGDPFLLPFFALVGAVLSWTLVRTGTVLAPVIAHQVYNTLQILLVAYLPQWV